MREADTEICLRTMDNKTIASRRRVDRLMPVNQRQASRMRPAWQAGAVHRRRVVRRLPVKAREPPCRRRPVQRSIPDDAPVRPSGGCPRARRPRDGGSHEYAYGRRAWTAAVCPGHVPSGRSAPSTANSACTLSGSATTRADAERLVAAVGVGRDGDERHLAVVVDLGQARQLRRRQLAHAHEHAEAHVVVGQAVEKLAGTPDRLRVGPAAAAARAVPDDLFLELGG